jgi:hypothetical protein
VITDATVQEREVASGLPRPVAHAASTVFGWLSQRRGKRIFHPRGAAFTGTARVAPSGLGTVASRREVDVLLRVSRGLGWPEPIPDFNGVAIRLVDAHGPDQHQDILLVSSPPWPLARHLLLPLPTFTASGYRSILPHRTPDGLRVFGAPALRCHTIGNVAADLPLRIELQWARLLGPWSVVAQLEVAEPLDEARSDELRFDPFHTGSQLEPATWLNRLRLPAYAASQAARPDSRATASTTRQVVSHSR